MRSRALLVALLLGVFPDAAEPATIAVEPVEADAGTVVEGEAVEHTFLLRNAGEEPVHITRVETSCGCTAAEPRERLLAPGAFTPLTVRVDTRAQRGELRKRISIFTSRGERADAWLVLTVEPDPHAGEMARRALFGQGCAACHYEPAVGLRGGAEIYAAACVMCHGERGEGGYAPPLNRFTDGERLAALIRHGTGSSQMPGFARSEGGPLTEAQIEALRDWLLGVDGGWRGRYKPAP